MKRDLKMDALWVEVIIYLDLVHITKTAIAICKPFSVVLFTLEIPSWRFKTTNACEWLYSKVLMLSGSLKVLFNVVWSSLVEGIPYSVNFLFKSGIYI